MMGLIVVKIAEMVACPNCGRGHRPSVNRKKFCSVKCYNAYRVAHPELYGKTAKVYSCEFCRVDFTRKASGTAHVKHHYCSSVCAARACSESWKTMKDGISEKGIPVTCQQCKVVFHALPYIASKRKFCSQECSNIFRFGRPGIPHGDRNVEGEQNPNYRGTNNKTTARQVALRHYPPVCMICGFDVVVSVHHVLARRHGGGNDPENLAVLCPNHHAMADRGLISRDDLFSAIRAAIARRSDHLHPSSPGKPMLHCKAIRHA
jgi:hypothetical protein